ncbi:hypothetical protein [Cryobacterium arcticum]|uniref:Uncharacterized protein n=1 Tax=Cryobacterium arcticum TaxID=670052 RepID=A0A317ZYZ6_9MICO|nr:hypothetical protein [Cryobacterium arcticum]PXA70772.1 hypothetical protein CTB96_06815 [Cryobacterium arcticum]
MDMQLTLVELAKELGISQLTARGNQLGFDYSIAATDDTALAAIQTVADACLLEFYDAVGRVWVSQATKLT